MNLQYPIPLSMFYQQQHILHMIVVSSSTTFLVVTVVCFSLRLVSETVVPDPDFFRLALLDPFRVEDEPEFPKTKLRGRSP